MSSPARSACGRSVRGSRTATLAPWSKATRAETWFAAKAEPTPSRIRMPRRGDSLALTGLAQTVLSFDVGRLEAAEPRMQPAARGHGEDDHDFARRRRIAEGERH